MEDQKDELDQETLIQLLKEKAKELKQTQKKLKKVEDKFVEGHKTQKSLIDDRETLIQFLQLVFPSRILEEEIMIMPEGAQGFGMLDYNHLRQFWTLNQQTIDNKHLFEVQGLQDKIKSLNERISDYEKNTSVTEKTSGEIQEKLNKLMEENDSLKEQIGEFHNDEKVK